MVVYDKWWIKFMVGSINAPIICYLHKLHVLICELQTYVYCSYKYWGIWVYGFWNGTLLVVVSISLYHVYCWWVSSMLRIVNNQPRVVVTYAFSSIQYLFFFRNNERVFLFCMLHSYSTGVPCSSASGILAKCGTQFCMFPVNFIASFSWG